MRILLIEDEQHATERLQKLLAEIAPHSEIAGNCKSIKETLEWLNEHEWPQLVISDVQLEDGLSFDIFKQLDKKVPVIFISAFDQYAIDAFKAEGLHYLLKPVKKQELTEAISRYDKGIITNSAIVKPTTVAQNRTFQERLIIHCGTQIKLVHDADIAYLYTENKVVYLVTFKGDKNILDISLEKLETILNPKLFYRINRQFIVHLKSIVKMTPASKQRIELVLDPTTQYETITSFERTPNFKKWLLGDVS